jgi:type II secretory ATPase GspE/PulE/Tfp pilus assembly ATPase PilB-like protein
MVNTLEQIVKDISKKKKNVSDLLEALIREAYREKASDIHMEHKEDKTMLLRYRIDGILHDVFTIEQAVAEDLVFMIKVKAKLRTDVHFSPQDGKIGFAIIKGEAKDTVKIDARISIVPITHGQKVVIRLLAQQDKALTLEELGFSPKDIEKLQKGYRRPYGLILSTGPTGSGKTTT